MIEASRPTGWKSIGLATLIFCCIWAARLVTVGGLHLTGDRLLGLVAVAVLAVLLVRDGVRWTPVHWALAAFTVVQLVTSFLAAPVWPRGPKLATVYVLGFACFALAAEWAGGRERLRHGAQVWIVVGAVLGAAGAVLTIIATLRKTEIWGVGFSPERGVGGTFAARGTFNEWNLYSSFLLVSLALALWAWERDRGERGRPWAGFVPIGGIALGLVFGVTRAAWVAMVFIAAFWLWSQRPPLRRIAALVAVFVFGFALQAAVITASAGAANKTAASPLYYRVIKPIEQGRDHNMSVRMMINRSTVDSWLERPVLGNGAGSINSLDVPGVFGRTWNGNLVLFVLHDSGIVGMVALALLMAVLVVMARRALGRSPHGALLVPLLVAGVALVWAYQFTHGLWLMYPYVYLGLLTASMEGARDA